ncbi:hypothetical protein HaLaN_06911 [Haematococcus lacustris]|uniref:Uncharacterized protein n=1 Tax=Haematococcus lacustris TaxID=44745 RepID=A0A699YUP4_HAELA|nr:hypothetical protein HaLaN_06911 [Haematococcus lacustris]
MVVDILAPAPDPGLHTASAAAVPTWGPGWPLGRCRLSLLLPDAGGGALLEPATAGWCGGHCLGRWHASPGASGAWGGCTAGRVGALRYPGMG